MNRLVSTVSRVGNATDAAVAAGRRAPGQLRRAWSLRRYRWAGLGAGLAMLLLYLLAIGDISVSAARGARPGIELAAGWAGKLAATRAPYLFEPVVVIRPTGWLSVFVSPGNLLLGGLLAALLAINVAASSYQVFAARSCRRTALARLVTVLPALGTGFACCAPTLLLAVGTGFAAALAPVFLPLRSWLFPSSVLLMLVTLLWTVARSPAAEQSSQSTDGRQTGWGDGGTAVPPGNRYGHLRG